MTQNNLPDNFNKTTSNSSFQRYNSSQSLNTVFTSKLDSTSDLRTQISGNINTGRSDNSTKSTTLRGNGTLLNNNDLSTSNISNYKYLYAHQVTIQSDLKRKDVVYL